MAASEQYFQQDRFHVRTVVARFTPSGELDGSFGVNGVRRIDRVDGESSDRELELGRDGGIIVAGTAGDSRRSDFAVIKLTSEGDLDQAFGNAGVKVIHTPGRNVASGVGVDRRGRITVGGNTGGISQPTFARLKPSGRLDRSFSGNGRKILKRAGDAWLSKIAVRPRGTIVATGTTYQYRRGDVWRSDMFVAKLRSDGSMSRKFGRRGVRTIDIRRWEAAYDLALQDDGKIVVAGGSGFHSRFAALRLTRRGRLDRTFSRNGKTLTWFSVNRHYCGCSAFAVTLQPNGRIILGGEVTLNDEGEARFALARYKNDGRPAGR